MDEKEYLLIDKIKKCEGEHTADKYLDELVKMYEKSEICRGHFKHCLWLLTKDGKNE